MIVILEQAFIFAGSVEARFMIVRVSLLSKKWRKGRTLPTGMSNNFSEAAMGEVGRKFQR